MEVEYVEKKIAIFQSILSVNNEKILEQLQFLITSFLSEQQKESSIEQQNELISFEEWNKQFNDNRDLKEYIDEYAMTLGEFRRQIYEAEVGKSMTLPEFENKVKQWKTKRSKEKSL